MKKLPLLSILFSGAVLGLSTSLYGQAVTTDPVGYVTFTAADSVDTKFGLPMEQTALFSTSVVSVASGEVTTSVDALSASSSHYLQFTDGVLAGQWFQVTASTTSSITVAEDLESLGAADGDSFKVVPFWTLSTLFGTDFPVSTNVFAPVAQVILNDVTAVGINKAPAFNYAYHDGSSGFVGAGWFDVNSAFSGSKDNVLLAPNTFITIRNVSGSEFSLIVPGAVPTVQLSIAVVADPSNLNDNLVYNPYPADLQLSLSSLTDVVDVSTNVFAPTSQVIVYTSFSGLNPSPTANYAYHDGSSGFVGAGWFDVNSAFAGSQDTVTIPAGGAFIIRKGAGTSSGYWTASLPYTL
ncbi:MAG: TIGR02597 family protein [Verrucomicrobiota bacterium]|nr:TIGR02597 family protein [Verrucomicrobiota bacterium]